MTLVLQVLDLAEKNFLFVAPCFHHFFPCFPLEKINPDILSAFTFNLKNFFCKTAAKSFLAGQGPIIHEKKNNIPRFYTFIESTSSRRHPLSPPAANNPRVPRDELGFIAPIYPPKRGKLQSSGSEDAGAYTHTCPLSLLRDGLKVPQADTWISPALHQ